MWIQERDHSMLAEADSSAFLQVMKDLCLLPPGVEVVPAEGCLVSRDAETVLRELKRIGAVPNSTRLWVYPFMVDARSRIKDVVFWPALKKAVTYPPPAPKYVGVFMRSLGFAKRRDMGYGNVKGAVYVRIGSGIGVATQKMLAEVDYEQTL